MSRTPDRVTGACPQADLAAGLGAAAARAGGGAGRRRRSLALLAPVVAEGDAFALRPPVPAGPFLPAAAAPWWLWVLVALAAAVLGWLVVVLVATRRSRRRAGPDLETLRRRARAALAAVDPAGPAAGVAAAVSLVVRRFLAEALGDPVLFETHEEFLARAHALARLPDDQRAAVNRHFAALARMKYVPSEPADTAALITDARTLLDQLQPLPPLQPPPLPPPLPPPPPPPLPPPPPRVPTAG